MTTTLPQNTTLFISDLHLDPSEPHITQTFLDFMSRIAPGADTLYILGDFFESYIGDDDQNTLTHAVSAALKTLVQSGTPIFFMHGNRDFLLGQNFAKRAHITLLSDPTVIQLHDQTIVLTHGDYLCTDDKAHQRFRKIAGLPIIQKLFLWLPLKLRKKIAGQVREQSTQGNKTKRAILMDVNATAVNQLLEKHHADNIIHGHTHRPLLSDKRIVLDAWHTHGNYLQITQGQKPKLLNMPHAEA